MRARQREGCVVVIECRPGPRCRGVAGIAGGREARRRVIRIGGPVPVCLVAAVARRWAALCSCCWCGTAVQASVVCAPGERKRRVVVIERRGAPAAGRVADRAVGRESRRDVIRIRRPVEVRLVARVARGRRVGVVVVRVALRAGQRRVHARQRIVGVQCVIEVDVRPVGRCVAGIARGGEARSRMVGIRRAVPIRLVAAEAGCGQRRVVVVGVALRARRLWRARLSAGTPTRG